MRGPLAPMRSPMAGNATWQPAVIQSALLGAPKGVSLDGELTSDMPVKVVLPSSGRGGNHPLESDEDQPTTGGSGSGSGSDEPDSSGQSANGRLSMPTPWAGEPAFSGCEKGRGAAAGGAAPMCLPPGLEEFSRGLGLRKERTHTPDVDHVLVMQGIDKCYTTAMLLEEFFHSGFRYGRDILGIHMPSDALAGANLRRCFLSFDTVTTKNQFVASWQGKRMELAQGVETVSFEPITVGDLANASARRSTASPKEERGSLAAAAAAAPVRVKPPAAGRVANFCTRCGHRVTAEYHTFCAACGAPLGRV